MLVNTIRFHTLTLTHSHSLSLSLFLSQNYEDTIQSLRSQVLVLSQKSDSVQKELDRFKACSKIRKHSKTSATTGGRKHISNS